MQDACKLKVTNKFLELVFKILCYSFKDTFKDDHGDEAKAFRGFLWRKKCKLGTNVQTGKSSARVLSNLVCFPQARIYGSMCFLGHYKPEKATLLKHQHCLTLK